MKNYTNCSQVTLNSEFNTACRNGQLDIVKYLLTSHDLEKHAKINANDGWGFIWACQNGYLDIIKYLLTSPDLKKHVRISTQNYYGVYWACQGGHLDVVEYLLSSPELKKHANIHANNDLAFIGACKNEEMNIVNYLVLQHNFSLTIAIQDYLNDPKNEREYGRHYGKDQILNLFNKRDSYLNLNNNLAHKVRNGNKKFKT